MADPSSLRPARRARRLVLATFALVTLVALVACGDDAPADRASSSTTPRGRAAPAALPEGAVVLDLAGRPSAVALSSDGLWITSDHEGPSVSGGAARLHDPETGALVATWPVSTPPVAVAPFGSGAWVVGATGQVTRLDAGQTSPGAPVLTVEVGGALVDAVVVGDRLYVGDIERSLVHVVDAVAGTRAAPPIEVPAGVVRLAAAGGRLWVTGLEREVTPVELASATVGPPVEVGDGPIGVTVHAEVVWVAASDLDRVTRVDAGTGEPIGPPIATGDAPIVVAVDGRVARVLNQDGRSAVALDPSTGERLGPAVDLPMRPRAMATAPDGGVWIVGVEPSLGVRLPPP